jgi:hypothetical protein
MELIEKSEPEVDREIRELATRWAAAEVDSDVEVLDELLAEEFCGSARSVSCSTSRPG